MGCSVWAVGNYAGWGDRFSAVGTRLVAEVGVEGFDVLDVATGHGPTAIAAARAGGRVTGLDITPELLAIARRRAHEAGVRVDWVEADMTAMPFPDRSFDRVLSTFGAMAAPDHRGMATELVRLCRPGGVIASTAWSLDSVYSKIGGIVGGLLAGDDEDDAEPGPMPTDWADPDAVRSIFAGLPVTVETVARTVTVRWPSIEALIDVLPEFGPLAGAVEALRAAGTWDAARTALAEMLAAESSSSTELVAEVPYAVTIATR
ncbi:methyltransferase family protein [Pseudonocardia hierapolitana]|uniref:Methyltransferase family protein n=1 Tax=Pseudonocardia hierapolitana TaxID=1128676 RepID=A0A561T3H0_9PSEU|nr:class I SAM-dependent methyltransferase [Pseudonocardia hierapolitana]TWF81642.1 methyltransferase family protein [Pseudonocardia hierapolitana]